MHKLLGILFIAVSAASFGTLAIFGRLAYADGVDTFSMLFIRFGVSALVMSLILLLRRGRLPRGRTLARLIGMGALGYVGQSFTFLTATRYASAGLVALLLYLYPLFVAVLSILFLRERLTLPRTAALALALVGTGLTVDPAGGQWTGILLAIGAALIYSFYILVGSEVMKHVTAIESSAVIFASAALVYAGLTAVNGAHFPVSPAGWLVMAGMILFSTLIPVATFLAGLERIGPTNAAMLSTLEPVVTVLLAAWLFGERLSPVVLLGGGLILASVVLLTRAELKREKR